MSDYRKEKERKGGRQEKRDTRKQVARKEVYRKGEILEKSNLVGVTQEGRMKEWRET